MTATKTDTTPQSTAGVQVGCPAGSQALGGGGAVLSGITANGPFLDESAPDGGGWIVDYQLVSGTQDLSVEVYAICAMVSS